MMHLLVRFELQKMPSVMDEALERYRRELDRISMRASIEALRQIIDAHTFFDRLV